MGCGCNREPDEKLKQLDTEERESTTAGVKEQADKKLEEHLKEEESQSS